MRGFATRPNYGYNNVHTNKYQEYEKNLSCFLYLPLPSSAFLSVSKLLALPLVPLPPLLSFYFLCLPLLLFLPLILCPPLPSRFALPSNSFFSLSLAFSPFLSLRLPASPSLYLLLLSFPHFPLVLPPSCYPSLPSPSSPLLFLPLHPLHPLHSSAFLSHPFIPSLFSICSAFISFLFLPLSSSVFLPYPLLPPSSSLSSVFFCLTFPLAPFISCFPFLYFLSLPPPSAFFH